MWELDHKESWALKNWHFQTVVMEKTLESPMDSKEIKSVNPVKNQPWIFIGRTDAEAETAILWQLDVKSWLTRKKKNLMLGKIEGRKRGQQKVRQYHRLNGHESEQTPGDSGGQRSLACCSSWGCKELALCIRQPKNWSISPSNEYPRLISFRIDWFDLLKVQGTLKSLLQYHNSKYQFFGAQSSLGSSSHIRIYYWKKT